MTKYQKELLKKLRLKSKEKFAMYEMSDIDKNNLNDLVRLENLEKSIKNMKRLTNKLK